MNLLSLTQPNIFVDFEGTKEESPDAVAAIHTWTVCVHRFFRQHFMCTTCRRIVGRIDIGQPTAGRIAVLQPHRVAAVVGFDLGIRLRIGQIAIFHFVHRRTIGHAGRKQSQNWKKKCLAQLRRLIDDSISTAGDTYRCWKTFKSAPGFGKLCEPLEKRSRIDWLSWAAVGPVSEKLRCCVFGGIFICKSAVHVCVPPDTFNLFDRGTADTCAVRPPFVPISIVWPSCVAKVPLDVFMYPNVSGGAFACDCFDDDDDDVRRGLFAEFLSFRPTLGLSVSYKKRKVNRIFNCFCRCWFRS